MFNPQYINQENYLQLLKQQQYENAQNEKVIRAVRVMHDLCKEVSSMDEYHQQQVFFAYIEIAKEMVINYEKTYSVYQRIKNRI